MRTQLQKDQKRIEIKPKESKIETLLGRNRSHALDIREIILRNNLPTMISTTMSITLIRTIIRGRIDSTGSSHAATYTEFCHCVH